MKTIAIMNIKGGVGKTITTSAIAYILATTYSKRVIVCDMDKQGDISKVFGVDKEKTPNMSNILEDKEVKTVEAIQMSNCNGLYVIPSNYSLMGTNASVLKDTQRPQHDRLKKALQQLGGCDYCIIDCPTELNMGALNALVAAQEVIVPVKTDKNALDGLIFLKQQIEIIKEINPNLKLKTCLLTMAGKNDVTQGTQDFLKQQGFPVAKTKIRNSVKANEATYNQECIIKFSPRSAATLDYKAFVREYMEGEKEHGKHIRPTK